MKTILTFFWECCLLFSGLGLNFREERYPSQVETERLQSSAFCQKCHVEIYDAWKNDLHALSFDDPMFMASYLESYFVTTGEAKWLCLRCHAPVVNINKDFDLKKDITKEGVTCDFCHSIKSVHPARQTEVFEFETSGKKRGPLVKSLSPAHETEPSELFKSSELCAGCHEYVNRNGLPILETFSEWKNSPYFIKGVQCQQCHMPMVAGHIVSPEIKPARQKTINRHAISAAHSTEQLQKSVQLEIKRVDRDDNFVYVEVELTNVGSGHAVPTGLPTRKLFLWVELRTPTEFYSQSKVYQRLLRDERGENMEKMIDLFQRASEVAIDTRLKPRETKKESFVFAAPKSKKFTLTARLEYLFTANVLSPAEIRVKMAEATRDLK